MDLRDFWNVQRVLRRMAKDCGHPVWMIKRIIQDSINKSWELAQFDPEEKALWDKYFPNGKPTTEQYILHLGHAKERGEEMPYLLKDLMEL